ncbi:MAG TPA: hypothetical protein PKK43_01760 [Spirochaetota bacterium]|nr:hypothetical protein [Spirochaetota bacterium]
MKILPGIAILSLLAVILFNSPSYSLMLVETPRVMPPDDIEINMSERVMQTTARFFVGRYGAAIPFDGRFVAAFDFNYLQHSTGSVSADAGDGLFSLSYYLGENGALKSGIVMSYTVPFGRDVYDEHALANVSLGRRELFLGPCTRLDAGNVAFHAYAGYGARQKGDGLFNKGFFSKARAENDIVRGGAGVNTSYLHPFIPSFEIYYGSAVHKGRGDLGDLPVEGGDIRVVDAVTGLTLFLTRDNCVSIYWREPLFRHPGYLKRSVDFRLSVRI